MKVWLIKPSIDTRDGADLVKSRIGLEAVADVIAPDTDLFQEFQKQDKCDVVIADECQFFKAGQIDSLRRIVDDLNIPVLCFGLRTDFVTALFEGSRRLFEIADSISEIKTICSCGNKAIVNARIDENNNVVTHGSQVLIGGNDTYIAMCHSCWKKATQ